MLKSLLSSLSNRWIPNLETAVYRPARGVIDLRARRPQLALIVATEALSELRRLEQLV